MEVTEGLDSVYYVASLTLPFNCKHRCGNADYTCDIRTYVEIPDSVDKSNGCIENQLTFKRAKSANSDYCETIVTLTPSSNALPQIRVPIDATIDGIYDGTFETFIQFSVQTDRGGDKIWENMKLPRAQVFRTNCEQQVKFQEANCFHKLIGSYILLNLYKMWNTNIMPFPTMIMSFT